MGPAALSLWRALPAIVLMAVLCGCAGAGPEGAGAVTVEAVGFSALDEGKPLSQAHREALLDARRNALLQAHVTLVAETRVRNMRLEEMTVQSRASGRLIRMEVLEAGAVDGAAPPLYRVRVRAVIRPLEPATAGQAEPDANGRPDDRETGPAVE